MDPNNPIDAYLDKHFCAEGGYCVLCGNTGIVDTRQSAKTPPYAVICTKGRVTDAGPDGKLVGVRTYCICPNGRALRAKKTYPEIPNSVRKREKLPKGCAFKNGVLLEGREFSFANGPPVRRSGYWEPITIIGFTEKEIQEQIKPPLGGYIGSRYWDLIIDGWTLQEVSIVELTSEGVATCNFKYTNK